MASKLKLGGLKVTNVEAALQAEEAALTSVHVAVSKQLRRLEVEEQLLQEMLRQAEQEEERSNADQQRQQPPQQAPQPQQ